MAWQDTMKAVVQSQQDGSGPRKYTRDEMRSRGQHFYESQLRARLEAQHPDEYVVINSESCEYEVSSDLMAALLRMLEKDPGCGPALYTVRVGHQAAFRI